MKKILFFIAAVFLFSSCDQDPIFFTVSLEVMPLEPYIKGFVSAALKGSDLYVISKGSRVLHQYSAGTWEEEPLGTVSGKLYQVAATTTALYVLAGDIGSLQVWKKSDSGGDWGVLSVASPQAIYGAGNTIFITSMTSLQENKFAIWYEQSGTVTPLKSNTALLTGAATDGTYYYLSTAGDGILYDDLSGFGYSGQASDTSSLTVAGIIALEDGTIAAVSGKNLLYNTTSTPTLFTKHSFDDISFTGALALWEDSTGSNKLLLLGINKGYKELALDTGGSLSTPFALQTPGKEPPTTLDSADTSERLSGGLGLYPVMLLAQTADERLFAAPLQNGLWSYRLRHDGWQWNAETP
ncbi:MAG: hypothetical protein LBO67_07570 [Spirochaetaceae bacterium]|jgi:hypothetical protein|nr:hypothetical protein [Spirochaetaceae bacterium]